MVLGEALGEVADIPALEEVEDIVDIVLADLGLAVDAAQELTVGADDLLEGLDDRERLLTLSDVGADGLAGGRAFAPDPQDVVPDLEGEAELAAEVAEDGDLRRQSAGDEGAGLDRGGDEGAGLEADHRRVLGEGHVGARLEGE